MKKAKYNDKFFSILAPESAYVVGLLAADGYISGKNSVSLYLKDTDIDLVRSVRSLFGGDDLRITSRRISKTNMMDRKYQTYLRYRSTQESANTFGGRLRRLPLLAEAKKSEYISRLHSFVSRYGRIPTANEVMDRKYKDKRATTDASFSMASIYKYFGSFNAFITAGGYESRSNGQKVMI
jgi:hypothetical protein